MRLLCWLAVLLLAGCSAPAPSDADPATTTPGATPASSTPAPPASTHAVDWTIRGRTAEELNFRLDGGAAIDYELAASAPVKWDVHSHATNGSVTIHASGEGADASGSFVAPAANVYSIYVQGMGATFAVNTTVRVEIRGDFALEP